MSQASSAPRRLWVQRKGHDNLALRVYPLSASSGKIAIGLLDCSNVFYYDQIGTCIPEYSYTISRMKFQPMLIYDMGGGGE